MAFNDSIVKDGIKFTQTTKQHTILFLTPYGGYGIIDKLIKNSLNIMCIVLV